MPNGETPKQKPPRKHHYLPQFYLRGFSEDGRSIRQIEKDSLRNYVCSIGDAAAIRDYHDLDYAGCPDPAALEKKLSEVEGVCARTLEEVIQRGIDSAETRRRLAEFVALMRVRVPASKSFVEASLKSVVRSVGLIRERKGKLPPVPKGFEDALRMENLVIQISNWKCMEYMFAQAANPDFLALLTAMKPTILRAPETTVLMTGDQPVAYYHPDATQKDAYSRGLIDPVAEVSFPLSSRVMLHLTWRDDAPATRVMSEAEVAEFNRRTIIMAESLLFTPRSNEAAVGQVDPLRNMFAGFTIDTLDAGSKFLLVTKFRPVMRSDRYV